MALPCRPFHPRVNVQQVGGQPQLGRPAAANGTSQVKAQRLAERYCGVFYCRSFCSGKGPSYTATIGQVFHQTDTGASWTFIDVATLTLAYCTWAPTLLKGGTGLMDSHVPRLLDQRKNRHWSSSNNVRYNLTMNIAFAVVSSWLYK